MRFVTINIENSEIRPTIDMDKIKVEFPVKTYSRYEEDDSLELCSNRTDFILDCIESLDF